LLQDDFFGIRIANGRVVFLDAIPGHDPVHVLFRRRVMNEELPVVVKVRMERESDQAFFVSFAANAIADIQEDLCLRSFRVVLKNVNHSVLFDHKQAIVSRMSNVDRPVEA